MKNVLLIILATFTLSSINAQKGIQFIEGKSWDEVLNIAEQQNKIVFLDAYTTWCGPCRKMSRDVFPLQSVASIYNDRFVNVKMDMEKGFGVQVAKKYGIRAFPTLLFVDANGEVLHRVAGYQDEKGMIALANAATNPTFQLAAMRKRYLSGERDANFLYQYAYATKNAMEDRSYFKIAQQYLNTQEDWSLEKNMRFILDFVSRTDTKTFDYLISNRSAFDSKFGEREVTRTVERLVSTRIDQLLSLKNGEEQKMFDEASDIFNKAYPHKATGLTASFKMTYYRNGGDRKNFALAAIEYVENMPEISADELSDIAYTFYRVIEDQDQLKLALKWSKKALKMQKDVDFYETTAALYHKLEKVRKSKKYIKKGIKYAKSVDENYDNLTQFLERINGDNA